VLNIAFMAGDARGLLDCRGLAERYGRVGLRADLLEMLVSDSQLPNEYGPLRGSG
jgi:hypothetical protein